MNFRVFVIFRINKIKVALKFFMKKKYLGEVDEILRKYYLTRL